MVRFRRKTTVMPEEAEVAVVEAHFVDETFAEEIGLVFAQVHVVRLAERVVHDHQRMEREVRQLVGLGIDPSHGTCGLQTESRLIGKTHGEIIGVACISKPLHLVNIASQVVCAVHAAVFDLRQIAVVTAMNSHKRIAVPQQFLELFPIPAAQTVLRVVIA